MYQKTSNSMQINFPKVTKIISGQDWNAEYPTKSMDNCPPAQ